MYVLGTILARAGSKGLPDKCVRPLLGHAVIEYTIEHALASRLIDGVVLTTDSEAAARVARKYGVRTIARPAALANDTATVDSAVRHAVEAVESDGVGPVDAVVLLYGNIPVRAVGVIDRAIRHLMETGADSVRTVAAVTKQHPDWVHRLEGDRMVQYRTNGIYRRQDLEPVYYHDGAVAVVTREALFGPPRFAGDFQGFLGEDRRAIVQGPEDCVDIDGPVDFDLAEAILKRRRGAVVSVASEATDSAELDYARRVGIDDKFVGEGCPVFVIAEAGVNHDGDPDRAVAMVDAAADSGADAIKFQVFRAEALTTQSAPTARYQADRTAERCQRAMLAGLELGTEALERIAARCRQRQILFVATPFAPDDVERVVRAGCAAVKLASTDLVDVSLLERACGSTLPLIVSTGAADEAEIAEAVQRIRGWGAKDRLVLLHCVSAYPTATGDANLRAMGTLASRFSTVVGYSDHTESTATGGLAVCAGASVLEKHFTLDRTADGPDHAMSLEPAELAEYVRSAREAQAALGSGDLAVQAIEEEVRRLGRKTVVARRDILAREKLTTEMLTAKRAGTGLSPATMAELIGRRTLVPIAADTPLAWEMVE